MGLIKEPAIFPLASVFVFRLVDLGSFSFSMIVKVKASIYFCLSLSVCESVCIDVRDLGLSDLKVLSCLFDGG